MTNPSVKMSVSAEIAQALKAFGDLQKEAYQLGTELEKFGNNAGKVFDPLMDGLVKVGATIGAIGTAVGAFAAKTASDLEGARAVVAQLTGAVGKELAGLQEVFEGVAMGADESFGEIAKVVGDLNTRLGIAGDALKETAGAVMDVADMTGEAADGIVAAFSRMMKDWGVPAENAVNTLDRMFAASQKTGIAVTRLGESLVQYGAPLRQLGFDLNTATALMAQWEREGVNMELVMGSLRIALGKFAKDGVTDTVGALKGIIQAIKEAGSTGAANSLALEAFGAKAGPDMAAAIREGRFEIQELAKSLQDSQGIIERTAESTQTIKKAMGELGNIYGVVLQPLGDFLLDGVKGLEELAKGFAEWAKQTNVVGLSVEAFADALGVAIPKAEDLKTALDKVDVEAVVDSFREFGESVKSVMKAFEEFVSAIPWEGLLKNLDDIAKVIIAGWAFEKISLIASGIKGLSMALGGLGSTLAGFVGAGGLLSAALMTKGLVDEFKEGSAAVDAYREALGKTRDQLKDMGAEKLKEQIAALDMQISKMEVHMAGPNGSGTESPQLKKWKDQLVALKSALASIDADQLDLKGFDEQSEKMKAKLEAFYKGLLETKKKAAEEMSTIEAPKTFSETVSDSLVGSIQGFISEVNTLRSQSKELISTFGLNAAEAGEALKESIKKRASDAGDELVKKFDNPTMKQLFGKALANLGKTGGDAMLQEIGNALGAAEKKLDDFKSKMDGYTKQLEELQGKEQTGEAFVTGVWGNKTTYAVEKGMQYKNPEKGSFEEYFNKPTYDYVTIEKPVQKAEKALSSESLGAGIDAMLQKLAKGLESFDASRMTKPIQDALKGIETSGETSGGSAGNKFSTAFYSNTKSMIDQVVADINNIPNVVKVTISKDFESQKRKSSLAAEISQASRG